jgi:FkbM family methyltransferase
VAQRNPKRSIQPDLVIDVGAHNGDDTAYYLARAFRVVAIEANPALAQAIAARFPEQVAAGRLTVLNVGIAPERGRLPFWVSDHDSVLSSFDRSLVEKHGRRSHAIDVECLPFADVLGVYGVPHYLKVDIEGHDRVCLDALDPAACPDYVSCEITHTSGLIERLHELGYGQFKLVNQTTYTEATPVFDNEIGFRALRKLFGVAPALRRLVPDGVRLDFDRFATRHAYRFPHGSSGPFGEETHGPWRSFEDVLRRYDAIRSRFVRANVPLEECWYDLHARSARQMGLVTASCGSDRSARSTASTSSGRLHSA